MTEVTGNAVSWLSLLLLLITCVVVVLRYVFDSGSIALQESVTYAHATLFMLAMAVTLRRGGHVRVDVFYSKFSPKTQALVDVLGTLVFLLPVCTLIVVFSWDYVVNSWAIKESSAEASGIPAVYLLKTLLLVMPVMLMLQGVAEMLKNTLFLCGRGGEHTPEKRELI